MFRALAVPALVLAACATTPPGAPVSMAPRSAGEPAPPFHRDGEIQFTPLGSVGNSAAWNERSVRGPAVSLTLTDQGLWGGTMRDQALLLRAGDGRISGVGVNLLVGQEGDVVVVEGLWLGNRTVVAAAPDHVSASLYGGACSLELAPAPDGHWRGFAGCGGRLRHAWMEMKGVAAEPSREMPQWFFAFLASLQAQVDPVCAPPYPFWQTSFPAMPRGYGVELPTYWRGDLGVVAGVPAIRAGMEAVNPHGDGEFSTRGGMNAERHEPTGAASRGEARSARGDRDGKPGT